MPLKEIAKVRFGIKTGASEFFYLIEEEIARRGIEKEFWMHKEGRKALSPNKIIVKANELSEPTMIPASLKNCVLFIRKDRAALKNTKTMNYVKVGEREGYNKRPTCAAREPSREWFDLGENINDVIAFPERVRLRYIVFYNPKRVSLNKNLYGVEPYQKESAKILATTLNSTLTVFCSELFARQPGGGGGPLDIDVNVAADILLPKLSLLNKRRTELENSPLLGRRIESIFLELGASSPGEVSLDKIKPDRRSLDKIVMGEILGLSDDEQLEVYRGVVDLVKSRIEKAQSFGKKTKTKEGIDVGALKTLLVERILKESAE